MNKQAMNTYLTPTAVSSTAPISVPGNPFKGPQKAQSNLMIRSYNRVTSYFGLTVRHDHVFLISYKIQCQTKTSDHCVSLVRNTVDSLLKKHLPCSAKNTGKK